MTDQKPGEEVIVKEPSSQPEEVKVLEDQKAKLEEEIKGIEGTKASLLEDVTRIRQEKREVKEETPIDEEAILAKLSPLLDQKVEEKVKPLAQENALLKEHLIKANEETLKAKKAALDSLNARIASSTAAKPSASAPDHEPEIELPPDEAQMAKELGIKNPRYMRESPL